LHIQFIEATRAVFDSKYAASEAAIEAEII